MKTGIFIFIAIIGLALSGCPSEKADKKDKAAAEEKEKSTDTNNPDQIPEDVQKKLKSLGYVQ